MGAYKITKGAGGKYKIGKKSAPGKRPWTKMKNIASSKKKYA